MKTTNRTTVNEVYYHVIDVTVETLRRYLDKNKKNSHQFDIPNELQTRWKTRLNCLTHSLNNSWVKFQDNCSKYNGGQKKKNEPSVVPQSLLHFPLVCMLSWDFFRQNRLDNGEKISGFKSWVWNCLISRVVAEGVYPSQSIVKNHFQPLDIRRIFRKNKITKNFLKTKKNYFSSYKNFLNQKSKHAFGSKSNTLYLFKKSKKGQPCFLSTIDSDSLDQETDEEIESQVIEETEENTPHNFILAIADKVYRRNTKWRVILKDGILHVNEKDLMFNACKCEFFW